MSTTTDLEVARHLAAALADHRKRIERNGGAVPSELGCIERIARFRVTAGQDGSTFGESAAAVDDQPVTQRLLTKRQVGEALAVSEASVKRLFVSGDLPVVHIGRAARVRVTDLDKFVSELPTGGRLEVVGQVSA